MSGRARHYYCELVLQLGSASAVVRRGPSQRLAAVLAAVPEAAAPQVLVLKQECPVAPAVASAHPPAT